MADGAGIPLYTGQHLRGVDASYRVVLPARWRGSRAPVDFVGLPWPVTAPNYLLFLRTDRWQEMIRRVSDDPFDLASATAMQRILGSRAFPAPIDARGRLRLPEQAAREIGIEQEALLIGRLDKFEIWSPSRFWDQTQKCDSVVRAALDL